MKRVFFVFILLYLSLAGTAQYVRLDDRIKNNLYLTVSVNKSDAYIGEPIIATYKLYSAFESVSTILKNPSFYGFSYKDIITPRDDVVSLEDIGGTKFDVHTIKKVQLTPTESGKLEVDALTMGNKIRVLDAQGRKISLLDGVLEEYTLDGDYLHFTISSVPITINVLSPSATNRPIQYNGAAGDFRMNVQMSKNEFKPNEQGLLTITIVGNGDFSKVKMPAIEWPAGIKVMPVQTKNNNTRGNGYKAFAVSFSGVMEGSYTIMPIQFSYFDTLNNRLNTITNRPITFYVRDVKDNNIATTPVSDTMNNDNTRNALIIGIGVVLALLFLLLFINKRKKEQRQRPVVATPTHANNHSTGTVGPLSKSVDDYLRTAADSRHHTGNSFYNFLKQGIISFFEDRFALPAVLFNRTSLKQSMSDNGINENVQYEVISLLTEIEMNIYSGGGLDADKTNLLSKTRHLLSRL